MPGKGKLEYTGKLGDVMKESIKAAKSFIRSRCLDYGIVPPTFEKKDFHVHVPEGATPKDGPSAGIAMVTSIVSALSNIPVKRSRDDWGSYITRKSFANWWSKGKTFGSGSWWN